MPVSKDEALRAVREKSLSLCEYSGKVRISYTAEGDEQRFSGLLKKNCRGDLELKVLGLFGAVVAEVTLKNGKYRAIKGEEDITSDLAQIIGAREVRLMNSALTFPPPLPDPTYGYSTLGGLSVFQKGDLTLITDNSMNIATIIRPRTITKYVWEKSRPKSAAMNWGKQEIKLDFYGEWR
ncbi:MAG: hypothetical protein LBD73_00825 [Deferribacteraceae bacterium]|nr:hypothetical protein [Deferribacteraceae bacterium]